MESPRSITADEFAALKVLARQAAEDLLDRDLFGIRPLFLSKLLKRLGLAVRIEESMHSRGMLRSGREIIVRSAGSLNDRVVILHEVGHAVLLMKHSEYASSLPLEGHEYFASQFATCMLLPEERIDDFLRAFHSIISIKSLIETAQSFRISHSEFLQLAYSFNKSEIDKNRIWLVVKQAANRYTGRDPKLRVVRAYYDKSQWFVPTNSGIERLFGNYECFYDVTIGGEVRKEDMSLRIQRVTQDDSRRFKRQIVNADVNLFGLKPVRGESGAHILALSTILGD